MTLIELLSALRTSNVKIWAEDGKLRFRAPQALTPDIESDLRARKAEVLEFLESAEAWRADGTRPAIAVSGAREYPLSFAQQRMWFVQQMHPGNAAYHVYTVARMHGPFDLEILDVALTTVVNRHDALRTTFRTVDGTPCQMVGPAWAHVLTVTDLSAVQSSQHDSASRRIALEESRRPFDLATGPLLRIHVIRLSPTEHVWIENFHHLIVDDWSMRIITSEWMAVYTDLKAGRRPSLPPLRIQFPDFAAWQRQMLQGAALARELAYWQQQLAGAPPVLQLAEDRERPDEQTFAGAQRQYVLPASLAERLTRWGASHNATLFMTLLTAYYITLSAYSNQPDILVGSPIAGRTHPDAEPIVGCCIGVVVLRGVLSADVTCARMLAQVRTTCLGAYAHPEPPLEELMKALAIQRDPRRNSIFQTLFAVLNTPLDVSLAFADITVDRAEFHNQATKIDLSLTAVDMREGLVILLDYCTGLFEEQTIDRMAATFVRTLEAMLEGPDERVEDLVLVDGEQRAQIDRWNGLAAGEAEPDDCVYERIERRAAETPDAVAVQIESECLTYAELDARANRFARYLIDRGMGPEVIAGVCLPRSVDLIVAIIGILKTGGAYLPIDPSLPADRTAFMLADSGAALLVTSESVARELPAIGTPMVSLDAVRTVIETYPPASPGVVAHSRNIAYVIYTSGSTGRPKGVAVEHLALSAYVRHAIELYAITASDRVLQFASMGFDAMVEEVYPSLVAGGTVVLRNDDVLASADAFVSACARWNITVLTLPTAFWSRVVAELSTLGACFPSCTRLVILGGEQATLPSVQRWQRGVGGSAGLINTYGPTEATVIVTSWPLSAGHARTLGKVPIGRPLGHVALQIVSRTGRQVPIGAAGELSIAGDALARGYLNRPDLTAEKFTPNPYGAPGSRMYRTGDLTRYMPDGNVEFLGRIDRQVKIRGFRVEPGELEAAIARHPAVLEAAVLPRQDPGTTDRLAAYIVARQAPPGASSLRAFLKESLPDYMIPAAFYEVDAIPRNASGKVDPQALADRGRVLADAEHTRVAPRTPAEARLAAIWAEVLGLREVGVHDDFYDLGGHSLLIAQLLSRVQGALGASISLRAFLHVPTVAGMADAITETPAPPPPRPPVILAVEASLAPEISAGARVWEPRASSTVLLTGATGFLGAHLLHELLRRGCTTIYALVRCRDDGDGRARLRANQARYDRWDEAYDDRIVVVPGDLAQRYFGMEPERFDDLAARLDAVYHNGAMVDTLSPYRALRAANVGGTHEALRLASRGRLKRLHYVSTMAVAGFEGRSEVPADSSSGYEQSKWVAEELVRRAGAAGLPVTIFRPAMIAGDTRTGGCNAADSFYRFVRGCVAFGTYPDVEMSFDLAPVDFVARQIADLSVQDSSIAQTFHIEPERPLTLGELAACLTASGLPVRAEDYHRWRSRLAQVDVGHPLAPLAPMFDAHEPRFAPDASPAAAAAGVVAVRCPAATAALIETYTDYLSRRGLLQRPASWLALAGSSRPS